MKRPSEQEKETHRKEIKRKAVDLVNSYFHLRGEVAGDNALSKRKISRVIQALTEGEEELFTMEHEENHHDRDFFGIKQENESQMIKKIGIEEHESMEKIMLCQFAMRSLECNSSEDLEKKIDLKPVEREQTPIVKVQEVDVKVEQGENIDNSLIFHYSECQKCHEQSLLECRLAHLRLRSLPRISYLEKSEDLQYLSRDCKRKNADQQNSENVQGEMSVKNKFSEHFSKKYSQKQRQSRKKIRKRSVRQQKRKGKVFLHTKEEAKQKGRRPENPEMEVRLIPWIISSIRSGVRLTQSGIRDKARQITGKMKNQTKFSASKGWIEKFFRRNPDVQALYNSQNKEKSKIELLRRKEMGNNFDLPKVSLQHQRKVDENQIERENIPLRLNEHIEQNY